MSVAPLRSALSRTARTARCLCLFLSLGALVLVGTGCGGDDEATGSEAPGFDGSGSDTTDATGDPGDGSAGSSEAQPLSLDAAPLPTTPLDPAVVTFAERTPEAPPVDAVVDTCAALPASTVDAVADAAAAEFSLGQEHSFSSEPLGAACIYSFDTHRLTIVIGPAAQVTADPQGLFTPVAAGDITVSPWSGDSAVSIFSEDSFDIDTAYAAHADAGTYGVFVANAGGTGIDYSAEGLLFAELAAAAASGADTAPAPADESEPPTPAIDTCGLWTGDELTAALGVPVAPAAGEPGFPNECVWDGTAEGGALVRVRISPEGSDLFAFEPTADDARVYVNNEFDSRTVLADGPVHIEVSVFAGGVSDGDAQLMLALNLSARLG